MSSTATSDIAGLSERVVLHDRVFQKYSIDKEIYCVAIDGDEEDRLEIQDDVILRLYNDSSYLAPLNRPARILDCGYGRGHWAVRMAQIFEEAEVTGIDIWPEPLPEEPENLVLECWDLNDSLVPTYGLNTYDFVHSRFVAAGIHKRRWRSYIRDLAKITRRGGWVQLVEYNFVIQSDSGRLTDQHALQEWQTAYKWYADQNRDPRAGTHLADLLRSAGLQSVQTHNERVPIGSWPVDARQRWIGERNKLNIAEMLESHGVWPLIEKCEWRKDVVDNVIARARLELEDTSLKLYMPVFASWARKP